MGATNGTRRRFGVAALVEPSAMQWIEWHWNVHCESERAPISKSALDEPTTSVCSPPLPLLPFGSAIELPIPIGGRRVANAPAVNSIRLPDGQSNLAASRQCARPIYFVWPRALFYCSSERYSARELAEYKTKNLRPGGLNDGTA